VKDFLNNYRYKQFGNKYFLTTDHGSFLVLNSKEFNNLKQNSLDDKLKTKLFNAEILLDNNNISEAVRLTKNRNHFLFNGTSLHIVVVTLRCNMNCIYCHASSKYGEDSKFDMSLDIAKKTVDFIFQSPSEILTIEFQGGEPLLNWDVVKFIINYANQKNSIMKKKLNISIVTNFSLMDEEKMNFLIDNSIGVCTSLDGPKELHDYNRKFLNGSNYESVIYWIKIFNSEYNDKGLKSKVNSLVTLTKKSLKFYKEIIDEYIALGIETIHLRFLNNLGNASKIWEEISYSADEYLDFWKKSIIYINELKSKGIKIDERIYTLFYNKILLEFDPGYLDIRSPCGAIIGQLAYNYDGNIFTCDEARMLNDDLFLIGNVNDRYENLVTCDKSCAIINSSINDQFICDTCVYKPYCGVCPVCNYAEQGNIIGKISQTLRCKVFKEQFDFVVKEKFIN